MFDNITILKLIFITNSLSFNNLKIIIFIYYYDTNLVMY